MATKTTRHQSGLGQLPPLSAEPTVSVVIPALNEERYIGGLLDSLAAQTYPAERIDVIVADGGSSDGTRAIVAAAGAVTVMTVRLVENPGRTTPHGLNAGIAAATSDVVVILGAHALVDSRFVEANVGALRQTNAAAAGGPIETRGEGRVATAIAAALSHPFGVGDARFRFATEPAYVDTIAFAAYRRECFELLGGFDTDRQYAEDDFFNYRIRQAGGRLYLTPAVKSVYFARSGLRPLIRQYFAYGRAKGKAALEEPRSIRPRHLAPAAAVSLGGALAVASVFVPLARIALLLAGALYGALALYSARRAAARRDAPQLAPLVTALFPVVHVSYGLGTLVGVVRRLARP